MVPYEVALTAVFVEGFVFVGLTILGIRQWLARYVKNFPVVKLSLSCDGVTAGSAKDMLYNLYLPDRSTTPEQFTNMIQGYSR